MRWAASASPLKVTDAKKDRKRDVEKGRAGTSRGDLHKLRRRARRRKGPGPESRNCRKKGGGGWEVEKGPGVLKTTGEELSCPTLIACPFFLDRPLGEGGNVGTEKGKKKKKV